MFNIAIAVHPNYMGTGIAQYLVAQTWFIFAKACKWDYGLIRVVAAKSYHMAKKLGLKELYFFPYANYKEHGKPVFEPMYDNAEGIHMMLGKADDILSSLTKLDELSKL
uniref:N-acetyltransferase domain-containing protein n=1 Tax=Panagrolaimus davidi TaxID=227884 RepID=A0A914P484_9BILA